MRCQILLAAALCFALPAAPAAQGVTGALIGTIRDAQGGVLPGAMVRVSSPVLIGGPATQTTNERGQLRFPALPPGAYVLDIELEGFAALLVPDIRIGPGATIELAEVMTLAGVSQSVVVEGAGSRFEARGSGYETRVGPDYLETIPTRRANMFDLLKGAPGISPTTQAASALLSVFGSGTNENLFLIDGTNFTSVSNGVARVEPGVDFIQEIQVQSVGASAEYGNVQGAVINVVTRQGGNRYLADGAYRAQVDALTSQPIQRPCDGCDQPHSGYQRERYQDVATTLGGPIARDRLWFFAGYQYLRDYDSQPGSDPRFPRIHEQDKIFAKLTWHLAPGWQLVQSVYHEFWANTETPTSTKPFEATQRIDASAPAITLGHLTHATSGQTVWDVRVGRLSFAQDGSRSDGGESRPSRFDSVTSMTSDSPPLLGGTSQARTTFKGSVSRYSPGRFGADHDWKLGGQIESGEHRSRGVVPTGVRYIDQRGAPFQSFTQATSNAGGRFTTVGLFITDALTPGDRVTINAGLRFDRTQASSPDVDVRDAEGHDTGAIAHGLGPLYTYNLWSPRVGLTLKLAGDGRTMLRASYGRFNQGVLTGETSSTHPGASPSTTADFDPSTGTYSRNATVNDPTINIRIDPDTRSPRTDAYSIGVDREIGRRVAASVAYVRKDGDDFIGWTDIGGRYHEETRPSPAGGVLPVWLLDSPRTDRLYQLTNAAGYSMTYNGLVMAVERRRAGGWQAYGAYTFSRVSGLQAYSGASAAGLQVSTVGAPPISFGSPITFGRDPNDLTNAGGRLPNDRPHMIRAMAGLDVPKTGIVVAANLQHYSGKPWAASTLVSLPQNTQQRILIEPRGTHRLESQTLLDLRVSRPVRFGGGIRIEILVDLLNLLNDTAAEGVASDNFSAANFGQPNVFIDPRRAMVGVKVNIGR